MISICVVLFNTEPELVAACVESVAASRLASGESVEMVIVDNGSRTAPVLPATTVPLTLVRLPANLGFAKAMNRAVAAAAGDLVLCLNPDAALSPTSLATLADTLRARSSRSLLVAFLLKDGGVQVDALTLWMFSSGRLWRRSRSRRELERLRAEGAAFPVRKVSGGALFGRRDDLVELGPFNEEFFLYGEDADLSLRAVGAGFSLLAVPDAPVDHVGGSSASSFGTLVERARQDAALRLVSLHHSHPVALLARAEAVAITVAGLAQSTGRSSSASRSARLARLSEIRRWGLRRSVPPFTP